MKKASPFVASALALSFGLGATQAQGQTSTTPPAAPSATSFDVFGSNKDLRPGEKLGTIVMFWCENGVFKGTMVFPNSEDGIKRIVSDSAYGVNSGQTVVYPDGKVQDTFTYAFDSAGRMHDLTTNESSAKVDQMIRQTGQSMQYDHTNLSPAWADGIGWQLCNPQVSQLGTFPKKKSGQALGLTA